MYTLNPQTSLRGRVWHTDDSGAYRLVAPSEWAVNEANTEWRPKRKPRHNLDWNWNRIARRHREVFALLDEMENVSALWASRGMKHALGVSHPKFYRLDFIEIDPDRAGGQLGLLAISVAVSRAVERGAAGILVPSLEETARIWRDLGAQPWEDSNWKVETGLVRLWLSPERMSYLKEVADGFEPR